MMGRCVLQQFARCVSRDVVRDYREKIRRKNSKNVCHCNCRVAGAASNRHFNETANCNRILTFLSCPRNNFRVSLLNSTALRLLKNS
jgi:hypothetical protein